jgi:hypothetical protein
MTILFFVYFGTHNNKIHTICKQTSVFVVIFFHFVVLLLLAKQQQQKSSFHIRSKYAMLGPKELGDASLVFVGPYYSICFSAADHYITMDEITHRREEWRVYIKLTSLR